MIQEADLKKEIIEYGRLCGVKNFTPGMSGNMSARFGENVIITSSGSANGYLSEDDFSIIDMNGKVVGGYPKPSSEYKVHLAFYKKRSDVNYIIHVHAPNLSSFASSGIALTEPIMAENVYYFGEIPLAEYGLPSSDDLAKKTSLYFDKYNAVLMANHGFIVGDKTMRDAYLKLELAEAYAQVVLNTKILGGANLLTEKQVKEIIALKG